MLSVYRLLSIRYLIQRWDRTALIVASIALGVATLVSARILNQCFQIAATDTTTPLKGADLHVSNGEAGVRRALVDDVRDANIPGVKSVQPMVFDRVTLPEIDGRVAVLMGVEASAKSLGLEMDKKPEITFTEDNSIQVPIPDLKMKLTLTLVGPKFTLLSMWAAAKESRWDTVRAIWDRMPDRLVLVSRPIFEASQRVNGGTGRIILRHGTRRLECLVLGVLDVEKDSPLEVLGKNFIAMEVGQASRVIRPSATLATAAVVGAVAEPAWDLAYPPKVNRIDLFLEPDANRDRVIEAVAGVVGNADMVKPPESQGQSTQEVIDGIQVGFLVCSLGAMVVGLFLVYNALAVTVAERRPDIGILRSIGATRGQIIRLFAVAALVLGIIGAALGVPVGFLLARVTLEQFRHELQSMFLNPELDPGRLTLATAGWAMLAGITTAVLAALVPAIQAASDDPAHVVRRTGRGAQGLWVLIHRLTCTSLVAAGFGMILFRHSLPPRIGAIGGMMLVLVGLLLAAPVIVALLVKLIRPLFRILGRIELRLAADNLSRAPGRTGVVIGALGAGVALMFQTAGVGRSNQEPVNEWLNEAVQADVLVFSGDMTTANSSFSPMEESVGREIEQLPGVDRVMSLRYSRPEYNGTIVYMIALDAEAYARATRARLPNGMPGLEQFLDLPGSNDCLVSDNFLIRHNAAIGDTIALPGPNGPVSLRIAGAVRDYSWSRGTIFMDRKRYAKLFEDELVDMIHVFLKPGYTGGMAEARKPLDRYIEARSDRGLMITDRDSLRKFVAELINRVFLLAYLQQIVVGVVAALGVVTALLISVLQRKRELGLLLAIGATPGQVLRSVLAEAVLMGAFGTALGILIGIPMEWYVLKYVLRDESGFVFDVILPWKQAGVIAAASMMTATLAGLLPAIHAVRTRIPDAIQYE